MTPAMDLGAGPSAWPSDLLAPEALPGPLTKSA